VQNEPEWGDTLKSPGGSVTRVRELLHAKRTSIVVPSGASVVVGRREPQPDPDAVVSIERCGSVCRVALPRAAPKRRLPGTIDPTRRRVMRFRSAGHSAAVRAGRVTIGPAVRGRNSRTRDSTDRRRCRRTRQATRPDRSAPLDRYHGRLDRLWLLAVPAPPTLARTTIEVRFA